jgi:protein phosphatase
MSDSATAETAVSTPRLAALVVLRTDVGLVRSENQDFAAYTTSREERGSHPGGRLLIVADGMGGHRGGATASRLATEVVKRQYLDSETGDPASALRDALTRANARIHAEAQSNADLRGMGTTTSALVLKNDRAWFAHVGDSRIYRVRGGEIEQLTEDHSLVASMVREGLLTSKEAENHPRRNVLQRSMGVSEEVEIDVRGPFDLQVGDVFILCSDGLHGVVKEPEIKEFAALPLDEAADQYVKTALERGAPDNVTVLVARIVRAEEIGDETLADSPYDETVRDEIVDQSSKTTAKIPAIKEPLPDAPADAGADGDGGEKPAAPQDEAKADDPPKPGLLKRLFFF